MKTVNKIVINILIIIISLPIMVYALPTERTKFLVNSKAKVGNTDPHLINHNNKTFDNKILLNKISLIYFGFTFCPDTCPTVLKKIDTITNKIEKHDIKLLPIFISLDPQRDKPKVIKNYLKHFNKKIIGLTGSITEIKKLSKIYKVFFTKVKHIQNRTKEEYMIDHSSFIYINNKDGKLIKYFKPNTSSEKIIEYILYINKFKDK